MNRRWLCSDVWMDILPSFDHAQLGLKMALLSDRFDILVDAHFDGKSELTIWRQIAIVKDEEIGPKPIFFVSLKSLVFPLPAHPLPNKIRFKDLNIEYIDHSVIEFLRSNKPIWDRSGTKLELWQFKVKKDQPLWDVFCREIWPIFATNIRHLSFASGGHLDNLRRRTSPTIFTDLDQLNSINSCLLCPDGIADDGPNATVGQALTKWLHTPTKNGQPKELRCTDFSNPQWVNHFKEAFLRATASVSYKICFQVFFWSQIEPFELVNGRTNEKLTLMEDEDGGGEVISDNWLLKQLKRCPIIGETAVVQKQQQQKYDNLDANLNKVFFRLYDDIGPLSPPGQNDENVFSLPGTSDQRKNKK